MPQFIQPTDDGSGLRVTVLVTAWYGEIIRRLQDAAIATLLERGIADADITVVEVPGAYELPQAAGWIARTGDADAIVALGCVVRGETAHFDFVAGGACNGLLRVAQDTGIPVGLGVITAENQAQADARSGAATGKGGNKGVEAADAAVAMARLYRTLEKLRTP